MSRSRFSNAYSFMVVLLTASVAGAEDWPQWLGPRRDSVWRETGIVRQFSDDGPSIKWRQAIGGGYAGPAVADGRVFVADYLTEGDQTPSPDRRNKLDGTERVLCLSADDGSMIWKHEYPCRYEISYPAGPRATPTVDGDRVYTLGSEGDLHCVKVEDGSVMWSRKLKDDYGVKTPIWGFCGHPLVAGNKLFCLVGGEGSVAVALDKMTGKEIWRSLSAREPGYSPPAMIEHAGKRQLLIWHAESLNSLDPETGQVYWSEPLEPDYGMSIITPRMTGDLLFVGAIKTKSMLLRLAKDKPAATLVWTGTVKRGIGPVNSTPFLEGDYMYGIDRQGELRCVELETGKQIWTTYALMPDKRNTNSGTAFLVKNGDRFFIFSETAELVIAKLSPDGYEEISRSKPLLDRTGDAFGRPVVWSHPAFANGRMYARNDKELISVNLAE